MEVTGEQEYRQQPVAAKCSTETVRALALCRLRLQRTTKSLRWELAQA